MKIVIDLGCQTYGRDESTSRLIKRFKPDLYYGFDPMLDRDEVRLLDSTVAIFTRKAAWVHNGYVWFESALLRSGVSLPSKTSTSLVPCFRLAEWLCGLPDAELIVKLDVEGAEYMLLNDLHETRLDERISLVLVEWHDSARDRGLAVPSSDLRCEVEEWA